MIVTYQERVLWPRLNPYQILCKVSVNNEMPDTGNLTGNIKLLCEKCLVSVEERPKIDEVLQLLLEISRDISAMCY